MLTLAICTEADVTHVLNHISPEDAAELQASGLDPVASFMFGYDHSVILNCVVTPDRTPVAIYGCVLDGRYPDTAIPWMVATPEFRQHPRSAMALSRQVIAQMQDRFANLHNLVHAEHFTAIRWLSWLGFTIELDTPQGPDDAFFYFHWSR